MRKSPFSFIVFSFLLAFINAGFIAVEKTAPSLHGQGTSWSLSSFRPLHTELEIHSTQEGSTLQGHHGFQKLAGYSAAHVPKESSCRTSAPGAGSPVSRVWAKDYLSHIYPSHNFW